MDKPTSLFDRLFVQPRRSVRLAAVLALYLIPAAAASADGILADLFRGGGWRGVFLPPTIITYVMLVSPPMTRIENAVEQALRAMVLLPVERFDRLVSEVTRGEPRREALILAGGAALGLIAAGVSVEGPLLLTTLVWFAFSALSYGLLAWTVYWALVSTRLTSTLLGQPLRVDPFDSEPFEPLGRQSLLMALVFVGGISLGLVFAVLEPGTLRHPEFWVVYLAQMAVPVVIFVLGMLPVHRVMSSARDRELAAVQAHLQRSLRELAQRLDAQAATGSLPAEINALVAYEERLQAAPTWPYNTGMLRTLVFSVFVPAVTLVGKIAIDLLLD